ncbi:MAG: M56 family metallopeptidase [Saprospiraceae bacterium]
MIYILKFTLCLSLLLGFYHLVLEKEKMHHFNRFYLLGSVLFSLVIPFYIIYTVPDSVENIALSLEPNTITNTITGSNEANIFSTLKSSLYGYSNLLIGFYFLMGSLFFIRFSKNLVEIFQKIKHNRKINYKKAKVVLIAEDILPHTFLNYIFINKEEFETQKIEDELLSHELAHVSQKHTFDIILIELLQVIFWFNPIIIFLKKAIRLNHEFLADEAAIFQHNNIPRYQQLLLTKATSNYNSHLASNINYSLTKKRFLMMTTTKSKSTILFKKLLIIPIILGLGFLFANKVSAQTGASDEMIKEYTNTVKKVNANSEYNEKDLIRLKVIYGQMSESQRKNAIAFPLKKSAKDAKHDHQGHEKEQLHNHDGDDHPVEYKEMKMKEKAEMKALKEREKAKWKEMKKKEKAEKETGKKIKKAKSKELKEREKAKWKEMKMKEKAEMKKLKEKEKAKLKEMKKMEKLEKVKMKEKNKNKNKASKM